MVQLVFNIVIQFPLICVVIVESASLEATLQNSDHEFTDSCEA